MIENPQLTTLEVKIQGQINAFRSRSRFNRKMALGFAIVTTSMSALATISIGVSEKLSVKWFLIIALIASGFATVLGAWEGLFSNRKLWVVSGATQAQLEELQWDINFRKESDAEINRAEIDAFNNRFKKIIQTSESSWQSLVGK